MYGFNGLFGGSFFKPCQRPAFITIPIHKEDDFPFRHGLYAIEIKIREFFIHASLRLLPFAFDTYGETKTARNRQKLRNAIMSVNGTIRNPADQQVFAQLMPITGIFFKADILKSV